MKTKSKYHYQFGAITKITLRDGEVSEQEKEFLLDLANKMEIPREEYNYIMQNYLSYELKPLAIHSKILESMYTLTKLVYEDDVITGTNQTK